MATLASGSAPVSTERAERKFFFIMACVMSALIIAGFSFNLAMGRSSFSLPWFYHFHAWVMLAWIGLYLAQNALIFRGNGALHRKLGWLSLPLIPLVAIMAILITRTSLQTTGGPFFFDQNQFLISNSAGLGVFLTLAIWAIVVRANTGWHRRLMFTGFAILLGPGLGRLLPMPLLMPYAWWIGSIVVPMLFPVMGMIADKRRYGTIHPAWFWGVGLVVGVQILSDLVAYSEWGLAFTRDFVAGTPGAERPMEAFLPPGFAM
ncbi:hypothetical protein A6F68_00965 [Tsuneonella dongtanensis]|uniref:Uncharacterized protein n=1 Tax=Tsuneonella dongtanensis TaxID=692370 RepID=A0A1B2ABG0_9SPHN|nr:hypothetical protein [Tsuneonella dongtanensis]ANY19490.1 hypothetical protein A6F68_00965 [Tsuneonella dongtanensis]